MQPLAKQELLSRYNIPAPRYTSYPTVPYWDKSPTEDEWKALVNESFRATNHSSGISLYIHLPYCESLCTYCACNTRITVNHAVEKPYVDALLKEWAMYCSLFNERPRVRELHLGGGTPTFFSPSELKRLVEGILLHANIPANHDFSFEGHPNNTTEEHLKVLYNLGFRRVSFGVQDLDPVVQDAIHRIQPLENVVSVIETARRIGYTSVNVDLVYGLPFQTMASVMETVESIIRLSPERIAFYSYAHVPWMKPGQRKFSEKDLPQDQFKRSLYEAGRRMFLDAGYTDVGMDHFSKGNDALLKAQANGTLHRNFMGYTTQATALLIGLGTSAISDTWTAFGQNAKTVEGYLEMINAEKLAVTKGHILSNEDKLIRRKMLDIMCRFGTTWTLCDQMMDGFADIVHRLEDLQNDGLIVLDKNGLRVTEAGRDFLRNICMALDLRYWRKLPEKQAFSSVA